MLPLFLTAAKPPEAVKNEEASAATQMQAVAASESLCGETGHGESDHEDYNEWQLNSLE